VRGKKPSAEEMKARFTKFKKSHGDDMEDDDEDDDDLEDEDDDDEPTDEAFDIEALFQEDDEDEDEDEEIDEDFVDAVGLLEAFADLDEDEVEDLDEDEFALVEEAYALMERGRAGPRVAKDDPDYFKAKSKAEFGGFKRKKLNAPFQPVGRLRKKLWANLKKGGLVKAVKKGIPAIAGALAIRAISRMAGPNITARNLAGQYGKEAIKELAALKAMSPAKRAAKASEWLVGKYSKAKLTSTNLLMRQNREGRRHESSDDLNNLIEEFRGVLSEGLDGGDEGDYYESCEALIENFQKVGSTAETLASRLARSMKSLPESEDPREDPRFEIGAFLESVARDASACLEVLVNYDEDGNPFFDESVDHDLAFEDLQNITSDLDRALTALADLN